MMDLISVIIPTHNRPDLLLRAISSVLNQTYHPIELIISDDASNYDIDKHLADNLSTEKLNIKVIKSQKSKGACHARNNGLFSSSGKYVTFLDDDDEYTPEHLFLMHDLFSKSQYSFVSSSVIEKNIDGFKSRHYDLGKISLNKILHSNCIGNNIFTLRERLISLGGFDQDFPALQDYEIMIRLISKYGDAFKSNSDSYIQYTDHDSCRISHSSNKRLLSLSMLEKKHELLYKYSHIKSLRLQKFKFSNDLNYTLLDIIRNINFYNYKNSLILLRNKFWY